MAATNSIRSHQNYYSSNVSCDSLSRCSDKSSRQKHLHLPLPSIAISGWRLVRSNSQEVARDKSHANAFSKHQKHAKVGIEEAKCEDSRDYRGSERTSSSSTFHEKEVSFREDEIDQCQHLLRLNSDSNNSCNSRNSSNPYFTSSKKNGYCVGDPAQEKDIIQLDCTPEFHCSLISKLPVGSCLFVKRSSPKKKGQTVHPSQTLRSVDSIKSSQGGESWSYGVLVEHRQNINPEECSIVVMVGGAGGMGCAKHSGKKVILRKNWHTKIRLLKKSKQEVYLMENYPCNCHEPQVSFSTSISAGVKENQPRCKNSFNRSDSAPSGKQLLHSLNRTIHHLGHDARAVVQRSSFGGKLGRTNSAPVASASVHSNKLDNMDDGGKFEARSSSGSICAQMPQRTRKGSRRSSTGKVQVPKIIYEPSDTCPLPLASEKSFASDTPKTNEFHEEIDDVAGRKSEKRPSIGSITAKMPERRRRGTPRSSKSRPRVPTTIYDHSDEQLPLPQAFDATRANEIDRDRAKQISRQFRMYVEQTPSKDYLPPLPVECNEKKSKRRSKSGNKSMRRIQSDPSPSPAVSHRQRSCRSAKRGHETDIRSKLQKHKSEPIGLKVSSAGTVETDGTADKGEHSKNSLRAQSSGSSSRSCFSNAASHQSGYQKSETEELKGSEVSSCRRSRNSNFASNKKIDCENKEQGPQQGQQKHPADLACDNVVSESKTLTTDGRARPGHTGTCSSAAFLNKTADSKSELNTHSNRLRRSSSIHTQSTQSPGNSVENRTLPLPSDEELLKLKSMYIQLLAAEMKSNSCPEPKGKVRSLLTKSKSEPSPGHRNTGISNAGRSGSSLLAKSDSRKQIYDQMLEEWELASNSSPKDEGCTHRRSSTKPDPSPSKTTLSLSPHVKRGRSQVRHMHDRNRSKSAMVGNGTSVRSFVEQLD